MQPLPDHIKRSHSQEFCEAVLAYQRGEFERARRSCEAILQSEPRHFEALHLIGVIHARQGLCKEALDAFDRALTLKPDHAELLNSRGNALMGLGRSADALASYDKALSFKPNYPDALNNRGNVLMELRQPKAAVACYDRVLILCPGLAEALYNRGRALREIECFEDALANFDAALEARPGYADALVHRGYALRDLKRPSEALTSFDGALTARPGDAGAYYGRGNALRDLGRLEESLESFNAAIQHEPTFALAHNNKALVLNELGRLTAARAEVEIAIELDPRVPHFYHHLTEYERAGSSDQHLRAMEELARDIRSFSVAEQIHLHFGLGKMLAQRGAYEAAFLCFVDGNSLKREKITYSAVATRDNFERTRAVFTSEFLRRNENIGDPSDVPIFIVGMPRSGSTLVEQIIASHPRVFGAGEIDDIAKAIIGLGSTAAAHYPPEPLQNLSHEDLRKFGAAYVDHIRLAAPEAQRITDKTPENFRFIGLVHTALPNARFIHIRRNPIDTCLSCFSNLFIGNNVPYAYDLAELGSFYRAYEGLMAHWRLVLPPGVMLDVDYEDLVADLEGQTRRILAHCRLDWDPRCLAFHTTDRPVRTASKSQVRQPLYKSSIGRWKAYESFLDPLFASLG